MRIICNLWLLLLILILCCMEPVQPGYTAVALLLYQYLYSAMQYSTLIRTGFLVVYTLLVYGISGRRSTATTTTKPVPSQPFFIRPYAFVSLQYHTIYEVCTLCTYMYNTYIYMGKCVDFSTFGQRALCVLSCSVALVLLALRILFIRIRMYVRSLLS